MTTKVHILFHFVKLSASVYSGAVTAEKTG